MTADELEKITLMAGVSRHVLQAIVSHLALETFLPGDTLCRHGDPADRMFVITNGYVDVEVDGTFLVPRGPDAVIGEQAMLSGSVRSATVTARSRSEALIIPRTAFEILCADTSFLRNLALELSAKLSQATHDRARHYSQEAVVFGEFRAHVSRPVLNRLLSDPADYAKPRVQDVVVLFSDIRDFTRVSGVMSPQDVARDLTAYFDHVVDLVHGHHGMVDKFVGDAVMAVWGAFDPLDERLAEEAFACACAMIRTSLRFQLGPEPVRVGVGLNAGPAFVGNVGSEGKRQFTVLGQTVNLAARYEGQTKGLGRPIVVGLPLWERVGSTLRASFMRHPDVQIKGSADPHELFSFDPRGVAVEE